MLAWIGLNGIALALATTFVLWLQPRPRFLIPVCLAGAHVCIIQIWVLVTGVIWGVSPAVWWSSGAAFLVLACAAWRSDDLKREWEDWRRRGVRTIQVAGGFRLGAVIALACVTTLCIAIGAWWGGPHALDVVMYHLVPPTDWVAEGRIRTLDWHDSRAFFPQGHGLLTLWPMRLMGEVRFALWAELYWVVWVWALLWAVARSMGLCRRRAVWAILSGAAVPIVWAQGVAGTNDLAVSVLVLTAAVIAGSGPWSRSRICLATGFLFMGMGVKPTALLLLLGLVPWWIFGLWHSRSSSSSWRLAPAVWLCATGGAALFWYVRNAWVWGNPLYPAGASFMSWEGDPGLVSLIGSAGPGQLSRNFFDLLWIRIWDRSGFDGGMTEHMGSGFGLLAVALGGPALCVMACRVRKCRRMPGMVLSMLLSLCFCIQPDPYIGRFFSFLPLLMGVAAIGVVPLLHGKAAGRCWIAMVLLAGIWSAGVGFYHLLSVPAQQYVLQHGMRPVPASVYRYWSAPGDAVESIEPGGIMVVYGSRESPQLSDDQGYPESMLHGPGVKRKLLYTQTLPDVQQLAVWREQGAGWFLLNIGDAGRRQILADRLPREPLEDLGGGLYAIR